MFQKLKFLCLFLLFIHFPSFSDKCRSNFKITGSLREIQGKISDQAAYKHLPEFLNIRDERAHSRHWTGVPKPNVRSLQNFLPQGTSFIDHSLGGSSAKYLVKFDDGTKGSTIILRANWKSQNQTLGTNVTVSDLGLINNFDQNQKWLIGPQVKAGVLFLHGGGTRSTGGHVAFSFLNHFRKENIAVISPDLPWHGEGPRTVMGDLDQEIMALASFIKKYVHPGVPLFIYGHSWGGSLALRIMQMTDKQPKNFFHNNLQGIIIASPAIDPVPGGSMEEKKAAFIRIREAIFEEENQHRIAPSDLDIYIAMALEGKTSPLGNFIASFTLAQLDNQLPDHKGDDYVHALMMVGVGDPLVFVGFEERFSEYFNSLRKVETRYLEELPLLQDRGTTEMVGHLLGDYVSDRNNNVPVNIELTNEFISRILNNPTNNNFSLQEVSVPLLKALNLYSNNLAFREWIKEAIIINIKNNQTHFQELRQEQAELKNKIDEIIESIYPLTWYYNDVKKNLDPNHTSENQNTDSNQEVTEDTIIAQSTINEVEKYKEKLNRLAPFTTHIAYEGLLKEIQEITSSEELKNAMDTFLRAKVLQPQVGRKTKKKFFETLTSTSIELTTEERLAQYFYIPEITRNLLIKLIKLYKDTVEKQHEIYVPTVNDFSNLNQHKAEERIKKIEPIVERQKILKNKIEILIHGSEDSLGSRQLISAINKNMKQIEVNMKLVKNTFNNANFNPPSALKEIYEQSREDFEEIYQLSKKINDLTELVAIQSIENQDFSMDQIECCLNPNQDLFDEFFKKYRSFILNRKEIRRQLITSIRNGDLTDKLAEVFNNLYGDNGLYKETDSLALELARIESQLIEMQREQAQGLQEYHKLIPFNPLSNVTIWFARDILNNARGMNDEAVLELLKKWNNLESRILPPLPE